MNMAVQAATELREMASTAQNTMSAANDRNVCEMPAKYSLSTCCRRPSYTSASASTHRYAMTAMDIWNISVA